MTNPKAENGKSTVLYIDDDPMNLRALHKALERMGYHVIEEMNAEAGVVAAQMFRPDVIILDVMMPNISGTDVAITLRKDADTKDIPLIALTADGRNETRTKCLDSGFDTFLTKPIGMRELRDTISHLLQG